ncbi:sigma factor [Fusobacterium necrophorum BFTR-2]|nr:sigma factor-like helix-turn-helix DNA-binding protein [Fusobacterium necrophorum]KDE74237.1 sigma factor [Fusobacterium necrophorum BFTR-2]
MVDDRKYIYIKGKKIYVSDEIYKAYKKQINHEAHLSRLDRKHQVYGFEDYKLDVNSIVDENVDIEKIIETKMRIEDLYKALEKLNEEEKKVIDSLYFKEMTIRDLAKEQQVSSKKIFSFRNKILKKLKEMLE